MRARGILIAMVPVIIIRSIAVPGYVFDKSKMNQFPKMNKCQKCDLSKADLHGAELSSAKLAAAKLAGANLAVADLSGTRWK
jgi:uncharacterized protein YjbI with pentapeptide repeats